MQETFEFSCDGDRLVGLLYLPEGVQAEAEAALDLNGQRRLAVASFVLGYIPIEFAEEAMSAQEHLTGESTPGTALAVPAYLPGALERTGRIVALGGAVLPLLLIGGLKFTPLEIEALRPLISGTPWLSWLYRLLGENGASYALGVFELAAAFLLLAAPWSARAGLIGGVLAAVTFCVTSTLLFAPLPVWDDRLGGFPALGPLGQFLIKDIALLGISLVVAGECLARIERRRAVPDHE